MNAYVLDSVLERDSFHVTHYPLCEIRLMDNKLFPWLILIPECPDLVEWIDLSREQQHQVSDEIAIVSHIFQALVTPEKLNIAMLGNQVKQLHIHLIGRYAHDAMWPKPVWGGPREYYTTDEREKMIYELSTALNSAI